MRFGTTMQEDRQRRESAPASDSSSQARWIKNFKDGSTTIRFLEELDEWTAYWEHYSETNRRYYPCTGDRDRCPGCTSDSERERNASKRYLVNALSVDTNYVDVYKVPVSLIDRLTRSSDQYGSITDRDYVITRVGRPPKVEYDREVDEKYPVDIAELRRNFTDHQEALRQAYIEAQGSLPDEASEAEAPQAAPRKNRRVTADEARAEGPPWDDPKAKAEDPPPSEPQSSTSGTPEAEEDEEVLSEDQVRAMSIGQVIGLYERVGMSLLHQEKGESDEEFRARLADHLINELTSED